MKPDLIAMITTHLNVPYGHVVSESSVRQVLSDGSLKSLDPTGLEFELLSMLFVECAPSLIGRACNQIPTDLENAHKLYLEITAAGGAPVRRWEDAMKDVVA